MAMIKRLLCLFVLQIQACFSRSRDDIRLPSEDKFNLVIPLTNRLPSLKTCTHESNYGVARSFENGTNSRIVGGVNAKNNEWPFLVRLEVKMREGLALCSGTVIDNYWILSAGHCCLGALNIRAIFSDLRISSIESGEYTIYAADWQIQPGFTFPDNDLCLINFDEDIIAADSSNDVQMACLTETIPETGTKCWVAGWGLTSTSGSISNSLKSVQVDLMNLDYCRRYSGYPFSLFGPEMICAGRLDYDGDGEADGGVDTCQGDSGGPLICNVDGQAAVVGVASFGSSAGCALEGFPGGYSSPAYWRSYKWVRETVNPALKTTTTTTTTMAATSTSSFTETRLHFFVFIIALLVLR